MSARIRPLRPADIGGFHAVLSDVASERRYLLTLDPPSLEQVEIWVRDNLANRGIHYVAEVDGKITGWADIRVGRKESICHTGELGMGVAAAHRRQGIGLRLLTAVTGRAWDQGLTRIELEVFVDNGPAIALYERNGFVHEGRKRNARRIDGRYQDALVMALIRDNS